MSDTTPSDSNRTPEQPTEERGSELGGATGSAYSERKIMVTLAALCIAIFYACVIGIGFYVHVVAGLAVTAIVAMWLAYSIASALKDTKDGSSPNIGDVGRAGDAHKEQTQP